MTHEKMSVDISRTPIATPVRFPIESGIDARPQGGKAVQRFVIIEHGRLWRESLAFSLRAHQPEFNLVGHASMERYIEMSARGPDPDAVIVRLHETDVRGGNVFEVLRVLVRKVSPVPVVALVGSEDVFQMLAVLDAGAKGCVPTSVGLKAIVSAMQMAAAGGFVLTREGLEMLRGELATKPDKEVPDSVPLTKRQMSVAEALRQGKPNKIIAYELGMCENTVKVHVRNILKKLQVTNRTEAAFRLNEMHGAS